MTKDNPALDAFNKWLEDVDFTKGSPNGNWVDDCCDAWQAAWNTRPQPCGDAVMPLNVWTVGGTPKEIALKTMPKSDGLKAREFQNRIVEWYVNHFPTIEAALTQPKADAVQVWVVYKVEDDSHHIFSTKEKAENFSKNTIEPTVIYDYIVDHPERYCERTN